jgi:histidinol phosphatase-like PHP family hydrolase
VTGQYDLHTHTIHSDGEMLPIELIRRMSVLGYDTVAITDHVDATNTVPVIENIGLLRESARLYGVSLLCGVEITHVPPSEIPLLAKKAKESGADIVVVHGETLVEPVAPGTNQAACSCSYVDILAHPGLIDPADANEAAKTGVALELTSRGGHNRANGHVARLALASGCTLVVDSDAHGPHDLLDKRARNSIARGAGLDMEECRQVLSLNIKQWLSRRNLQI